MRTFTREGREDMKDHNAKTFKDTNAAEEKAERMKSLARFLIGLGLIPQSFTGRLLLDFNQGGVRSIEKSERL